MNHRLLISGIPGTGKSTFGRWLRDERGFVYVNVEAPSHDPESLDGTGFRAGWDSLFRGDAEPIRDQLEDKGKVVFDWGFPVGSIFAVTRDSECRFRAVVVRWRSSRRSEFLHSAGHCVATGIRRSMRGHLLGLAGDRGILRRPYSEGGADRREAPACRPARGNRAQGRETTQSRRIACRRLSTALATPV